ncbi:hypothetical protein [Nonomuraea sp. NPDC049400]
MTFMAYGMLLDSSAALELAELDVVTAAPQEHERHVLERGIKP